MLLDGKKKSLKSAAISFIQSLRCPLSIYEYWGVLFIACFSLFIPKLWFGITAFLIFKTHREELKLKPIALELPNVVLHIQMNHIASLTEAIESNPEILYHHYKKQTLLGWCHHYKNPVAQSAILKLMEKHPQPQTIAA